MKAQRMQFGFTLLSTLFLLVVVSALAGYLVHLSSTQHLSSALSISAARARYALTSGLDWLAYDLNARGACPVLPATVAVDDYTVTVSVCDEHLVTEAGNSFRLYDVVLNASRGSFGSPDFTNAQMRATLSD